MLIYDNGVVREMTEDEEQMANSLPDPETTICDVEAFSIIFGGAE